jgi:predicted phage terminase large subunit-like protein
MPTIANSTYLDAYGNQLATAGQFTALASSTALANAQAVLGQLQGILPSSITAADSSRTITVALTLNRANDPSALLASDWSTRQAGQITRSLGPFIDKRMEERGIRVWREQYSSATDKAARAQSIRGRMAMGKVLFPRHAPWVKHVVPQLLAFPAGKHDDAVDVLGLFGRMLDQMDPARADKPRKQRPYRGPNAWMG